MGAVRIALSNMVQNSSGRDDDDNDDDDDEVLLHAGRLRPKAEGRRPLTARPN